MQDSRTTKGLKFLAIGLVGCSLVQNYMLSRRVAILEDSLSLFVSTVDSFESSQTSIDVTSLAKMRQLFHFDSAVKKYLLFQAGKDIDDTLYFKNYSHDKN